MPAIDQATIESRIICSALSALDVVTAAAPLDLKTVINLANGTGAGKANQVWSDKRTLSASATESLDLAGSLTDAFGATITFARIKAILILADAGNTNDVIVGAASNPFIGLLNAAGTITLKPGGGFLAWDKDAVAMVVTASTGDLLKVANSAGTTSVTYTIVLIGEA